MSKRTFHSDGDTWLIQNQKDKVTRRSRKYCFKRQMGRVTKSLTHHSFFFFFFFLTVLSYNLQVWGQADSNREASVGFESESESRLFVTRWTMALSRQEYWSGLPFPSPGDLPNPGIEPRSPELQADTLTSEPPGKSNAFWLPLFISFCLLPSEPALCKLGLAREGANFFTSHHSFWSLLLDSSSRKFL